VAALECVLGLRAQAPERLEIALLAPERDFTYRPLTVRHPFGSGSEYTLPLADFCAEQDVNLDADGLAAVDADQRVVATTAGAHLSYDELVVAVGARPQPGLAGAITYGAPSSRRELTELLMRLNLGVASRVVFVVPAGTAWSLPLYELALLTAAQLRTRGVSDVELSVVTPERSPLAAFGEPAGESVARILDEHGIALHVSSVAAGFEHGVLELRPGGSIEADAVVALPRLEGPYLAGLPHDVEGFIPVDELCAVRGVHHVHAAGDATASPIKQGGLAAQQADTIADVLAGRSGAAVTPRPFEPVLRGILAGSAPALFLEAPPLAGVGEGPTISEEALWWPPAKIASRHLAPYLAERWANLGLRHPPALRVT
jgi:sulfide:quinone oxidoreductase